MDKILKALRKFSRKERNIINEILEALKNKKTEGFNIKKLKNRDDIFRIRKGKLRILYQKKDDKIILIMIDRRNEGTYKK
jgi:mRNA-degrading endonuclease RelE of RelBE toxin-antitoxin system